MKDVAPADVVVDNFLVSSASVTAKLRQQNDMPFDVMTGAPKPKSSLGSDSISLSQTNIAVYVADTAYF